MVPVSGSRPEVGMRRLKVWGVVGCVVALGACASDGSSPKSQPTPKAVNEILERAEGVVPVAKSSGCDGATPVASGHTKETMQSGG